MGDETESCILDKVNKGLTESKGRIEKPEEASMEGVWVYFQCLNARARDLNLIIYEQRIEVKWQSFRIIF